MQAPGELPTLSFAVPVAAGLAGIVLSFVLSPFELVKVICLACCSALLVSVINVSLLGVL